MNKGFQYFPEKLHSKVVKIANIPAHKFFGTSKPQEIFYSKKDGDWSDITIWETVSGRPGKLPNSTDDVYIGHSVIVNSVDKICNNLFIKSGAILSLLTSTFNVYGNIQSIGQITSTSAAIIVYGINNSIDNYSAGTGSFTYAGEGAPVLDLSYYNLTIKGNVTSGNYYYRPKNYLTKNLTVNNNLVINNAQLDLSFYDLTVNGTTTLTGGFLHKPNTGNVTFIGAFNGVNGASNIDFSGNPTVEARNGFAIQAFNNSHFNSGTGNWNFTTNNQQITFYTVEHSFSAPVFVSAGITVTQVVVGGGQMSLLQYLDIAGSWVNKGYLSFKNASYPVPTGAGTFDYNTFSTSKIGYEFNGSYTLPYTVYQALVIGGTGTKTPPANISTSLLQVNSGGTFDLSSYNFDNSGVTTNNGTFLKTGVGNILFTGLLANNGSFNLSGNPTVELRGGANIYVAISSGTGLWTFTTNNQSIDTGVSNTTIAAPWLISGTITLTFANINYRTITLNNYLDGNNAASKLDNRFFAATGVSYKSATQPMVTGILETNAGANIWKYNASGNQDVKGNTYRTLEFGDSGVKKLLGNVVVDTTSGGSWSITGTATIDYNGFTITTI